MRTEHAPLHTYEIQLTAGTVAPVAKDDVLLVTFFLRGVESADESGEARASFVFELAREPYTNSITVPAAAGSEWRRIDVPFMAVEGYAPGRAQMNFQLGFGPQTLELAGISVTNYGTRVRVQDLPRTRFSYAGRETSAAWRRDALARIERHRRADLTVLVRDTVGTPARGVDVSIVQRRHAFGFGSAVAAEQLVAQGRDGDRYREVVESSFSKVVLENDLKWSNWEDPAQRPRTLRALEWLHRRAIPVRGQTLVWPAWRWLPRDLPNLRQNPEVLRRRVAAHVVEEVGALRGQLTEWDVVNEPFMNHDLMDVLGQEVMAEWFRLAHAADPAAHLFLNEAIAPGLTDRQRALEDTTRALLDAGAPLHGVGFQCHFGLTVTPPEMLLRGLDRFAGLGLPVQVTEFDVDTPDDDVQADYTRDFLIAMFSHPSVDAMLMWGFWEGRHWKPAAAMYRRDWTLKPNGAAWLDQVTRQWRTTSQGVTDGEGRYATRGFMGEYEVRIRRAGSEKAMTATLAPDGTTLEITLN